MRAETRRELIATLQLKLAVEDVSAPPMKKPVYAGVFLDEHAMKTIFDWFMQASGKELLPVPTKNPHLTSAFGPSIDYVKGLPLGQSVKLTVEGWAADDKGQAVAVSGFQSQNEVPHVTLATAKGVSPVYSKELLNGGFTKVKGPTVEGIVGYFDGQVKTAASPSKRTSDGQYTVITMPKGYEMYRITDDGLEIHIGTMPNNVKNELGRGLLKVLQEHVSSSK